LPSEILWAPLQEPVFGSPGLPVLVVGDDNCRVISLPHLGVVWFYQPPADCAECISSGSTWSPPVPLVNRLVPSVSRVPFPETRARSLPPGKLLGGIEDFPYLLPRHPLGDPFVQDSGGASLLRA